MTHFKIASHFKDTKTLVANLIFYVIREDDKSQCFNTFYVFYPFFYIAVQKVQNCEILIQRGLLV